MRRLPACSQLNPTTSSPIRSACPPTRVSNRSPIASTTPATNAVKSAQAPAKTSPVVAERVTSVTEVGSWPNGPTTYEARLADSKSFHSTSLFPVGRPLRSLR